MSFKNKKKTSRENLSKKRMAIVGRWEKVLDFLEGTGPMILRFLLLASFVAALWWDFRPIVFTGTEIDFVVEPVYLMEIEASVPVNAYIADYGYFVIKNDEVEITGESADGAYFYTNRSLDPGVWEISDGKLVNLWLTSEEPVKVSLRLNFEEKFEEVAIFFFLSFILYYLIGFLVSIFLCLMIPITKLNLSLIDKTLEKLDKEEDCNV